MKSVEVLLDEEEYSEENESRIVQQHLHRFHISQLDFLSLAHSVLLSFSSLSSSLSSKASTDFTFHSFYFLP